MRVIAISETPERIALSLEAGVRYTILFDGYNSGDAGPITLRVKGPHQPSANDSCSLLENQADLYGLYMNNPASLNLL